MNNVSVAIVETSTSNSQSVLRAFNRLNVVTELVSNPKKLRNYSHIVIPGVSRFDVLMEELDSLNLNSELEIAKTNGKAILGLCAGMQVMGKSSEESPGCQGLNWFDFHVQKIESSAEENVRNFHTGWNDVVDSSNELPSAISGCYYFNHSYFVNIFSPTEVIGITVNHVSISAIVKRDNIIGAQFHPEKSQKDGLMFLEAFTKMPT
jgi:glutamine amidotransferase